MFHHTCLLLTVLVTLPTLSAGDWTRFRGPNGSGVSSDNVPTTWSESKNVKWKTDLPGPGLSSPIVIGNRIVVTCWTGYAAGNEEGSLDDLKRNVICIDRGNGKIVWNRPVDSTGRESTYTGMFAQNGYASHSPVTDGERVYVFFGKSGVRAFDLSSGKQLWQKDVGQGSQSKNWGSASSPIVHGKKVIVPAFIEGNALVAFDGVSGKVAWKQEVPGYEDNWSTPILVEAEGRTDLVLSVPGEVWGLNPDSGKLRWYCEVPGSQDSRASVTAFSDVVIASAGGRGANLSIAVRAGGKGDVGESHVLWETRYSTGISTPVVHNDRVYCVKDSVLSVFDLKSGDRVSQARMSGSSEAANSGGGRGFGAGRGYGRGSDYSSPIVSGNHLYYAKASGEIFVYELGDKPKQIAVNRFSDGGQYNATPAVSDGQLFIRSTKSLYCVTAE